jgi:hypothetical protein
MRFDDPAADGESDAGSAGRALASLLDAVEALEHARQMFGFDA